MYKFASLFFSSQLPAFPRLQLHCCSCNVAAPVGSAVLHGNHCCQVQRKSFPSNKNWDKMEREKTLYFCIYTVYIVHCIRMYSKELRPDNTLVSSTKITSKINFPKCEFVEDCEMDVNNKVSIFLKYNSRILPNIIWWIYCRRSSATNSN